MCSFQFQKTCFTGQEIDKISSRKNVDYWVYPHISIQPCSDQVIKWKRTGSDIFQTLVGGFLTVQPKLFHILKRNCWKIFPRNIKTLNESCLRLRIILQPSCYVSKSEFQFVALKFRKDQMDSFSGRRLWGGICVNTTLEPWE